jgi:hypothetical protein
MGWSWRSSRSLPLLVWKLDNSNIVVQSNPTLMPAVVVAVAVVVVVVVVAKRRSFFLFLFLLLFLILVSQKRSQSTK